MLDNLEMTIDYQINKSMKFTNKIIIMTTFKNQIPNDAFLFVCTTKTKHYIHNYGNKDNTLF